MWRRLRSAAVVAFQGDAGRKPKGDSMDSPKEKPSAPDVLVHNEGTVFLFNALYSGDPVILKSAPAAVRYGKYGIAPQNTSSGTPTSASVSKAFWYFSYNGRIAAAARLS